MELIYKGNKANYNNQLLFKDIDTNHLKWKWSPRKNKYYYKEGRTIDMVNYMFVLFKNDYVLVFKWDNKKWIAESVRNYYHIIKDWIAYEITPKIEMPF